MSGNSFDEHDDHDEYEDDENEEEPRTVSKPDQLLALHGVTKELFDILRKWFLVPSTLVLNIEEIDSAVMEMGDPVMIAGMAMRKLQALHLLSTPGVMTTTDVVITIVQDLQRALMQAPVMHLKLQAETTDWDAAFVALEGDEPTHMLGEEDSMNSDDSENNNETNLGTDQQSIEDLMTFADMPDNMTVEDILGHGEMVAQTAGLTAEALDREVEHFHELHSKLHEAVFAVLEASEGEICFFV